MNPYPSPSSITMQRPGEEPLTITMEDAVVIMTNQQKTIEDLIRNNQKMFQYIQEMQNGGGYTGNGNVQFVQQNLNDPAAHLGGSGGGFNRGGVSNAPKPMSLSEYLAQKKAAGGATTTTPSAVPTPTPTPAAPTSTKPMTLSEYLESKKAASTLPPTPPTTSSSSSFPVFTEGSKLQPNL